MWAVEGFPTAPYRSDSMLLQRTIVVGDAAVLVVSVHGGAGVGRNLLNEIFPQRLRRKER
eukprot:5340880-Pyramimonas_sp.AAC.2